MIGSAYVFFNTGAQWTQTQKLLAADGSSDNEFGQMVAIHGSTVAIGAHTNDNPRGTDAGAWLDMQTMPIAA